MTREDLRSWLDDYRHAWEGRDPDAAARLFHEHATYEWGPFGRTYCGREEIRTAWRTATSRQEQVSFGAEVLAVDDMGVAHWHVSYVVPGESLQERNDGIFLITLDDARLCTTFREWWNTETSELPD
jgi:hypothetical protein